MPSEQSFVKSMMLLKAAFPASKFPPTTEQAYSRLLSDLPDEVLEAACLTVSRTWEYASIFPPVAEILKAGHSLTTAPARTGVEAWGDVEKAVSDHGCYNPPNGARVLDLAGPEWSFGDPLVGRLVDSFSWREICLTEDIMPLRAQFIKAYESATVHADREALLPPEARKLLSRVTERLALR